MQRVLPMYRDAFAFICDMDQVIAAAGSGKKEVEEQYISKPLEKVLEARRAQCASSDDKKYVKVLAEQEENYSWEIIQPILCEGDVIGGVVLLLKEGKRSFHRQKKDLQPVPQIFWDVKWNLNSIKRGNSHTL